MARIIGASIDVIKIDKSKLIEGKNGAKYYNFDIIVNDEPDKFGKDVVITAGQSKEEREAKEKRVYIGSGKTMWTGESKKSASPAAQTTETNTTQADDGSDLPF